MTTLEIILAPFVLIGIFSCAYFIGYLWSKTDVTKDDYKS